MAIPIENIQPLTDRLLKNMELAIIGKRRVLELVVIGLLSQGHILIEDVPGVGKTILGKSLALSLGLKFSRIQFTPDMLPSDVTGASIFNQQNNQFEFRAGPIMGQIILGDEINRATPKTQSALLEAMEEKQITVDGIKHALPEPFMVIGTQNPIEYEGTFPLPEAQLDRFLMRITIGYPSRDDEINILNEQQYQHPINTLDVVISQDELLEMQRAIRSVHVSDPIKQYIVDIVRATRENGDVYLGSSPRGSLGLYRTGQAMAALRGRDFVLPDDIKDLADSIISHRIILSPAAKINNLNPSQIIEEILYRISVPGTGIMQTIDHENP